MFAQSPSSLKTFKQCPLKYYHQYIQHSLPYVQHPNAARGDKIHHMMEKLCDPNQELLGSIPPDFPRVNMFKNSELILSLIEAGWKPMTELNVATDGMGNDVAYKSQAAWIRCRVDLVLTHSDHPYAIIIDWKTGKIYDDDVIQLEMNALCLAPKLGLRNFHVMFAYLDQGKIKSFPVYVDTDKPRALDRQEIALCSTPMTLLAMHDLYTVYEKNVWAATPNNFCRWRDKKTGEIMGCEVKECMHGKYGV